MCGVGRFFATMTPVAEEEVAWLGGTIRLGTPDQPSGNPDPYETSLEFVAPSRLGAIELPAYQRLLVRSALQLLGCPSLEAPG
jgi:hypothetical protein